ncbi:MAG: glycosyltransferase, partial [Proteobacteria bacterium]
MNKLVSVLIPSYNHAAFISETIQSILAQTYQNFEIIIVDDGSKDHTEEVVNRFVDSRIRYFPFSHNKGAAEANSEAVRRSQGEYICVISSDDTWVAHKLETQVNFLNANAEIGAVFTKVNYINEESEQINAEYKARHGDVFDQANRSRTEWLKRFFFEGNCLCHPSVMLRRLCYEEIGLYDNRFRQLPDQDFWIRLLKKFQIHVLDERLVNFRILNREANASSPSLINQQRTHSELFLIGAKFFNDLDQTDFRAIFDGLVRDTNFSGEKAYEIEKAFALLEPVPWLSEMYAASGYLKLYSLMQNDEARE